MGTHLKGHTEALQMSTYNIHFCGQIRIFKDTTFYLELRMYLTYFTVCNFSIAGQHCLKVSIIAASIFQPAIKIKVALAAEKCAIRTYIDSTGPDKSAQRCSLFLFSACRSAE